MRTRLGLITLNISEACAAPAVGALEPREHVSYTVSTALRILHILYDLHHLCGSPSYSFGSRDEPFSPARVSGIELLNGCRTLNESKNSIVSSVYCFSEWNRTTSSFMFESCLTQKKLQVSKFELTLPLSTISFCKSVEAMINIRMAYRTSG